MFSRVLIANRGEIAVRVAQGLRELGIAPLAVYSEPDRAAPHVSAADEAHPLEGATAAETYLRGDRIIEIARQCGADAVHPGYGFLSENAAFAQACSDAGLCFIGPKPQTIRAMGDKVRAKALMREAGVPVVPGVESAAEDRAQLEADAAAIGYPVLVKAAAGGGGKGMRVVGEPAALRAAVEAAQREAGAAFGDRRVFLEKYVARARHVEFQILGDEHGAVVHLFERECSIQRRHQKIIEEAPAPGLAPAIRDEMGAAAVRAAQAISYTNAGTVEFMVDDAGAFYFLEVNTRLQVEHPVTELTTRRDLVHAQVRAACGEPLPFRQEDLTQEGHAIECRVCAEDPSRDFLPSTGTIHVYVPPAGPGIRVDSGVTEGSTVTVHYDPMLAKLVVWGETRPAAIARMRHALDSFVVLGVTTNIGFLRSVLDHPAFTAGVLSTRFLEEHAIATTAGVAPEAMIVAALESGVTTPPAVVAAGAITPWSSGGAWRIVK